MGLREVISSLKDNVRIARGSWALGVWLFINQGSQTHPKYLHHGVAEIHDVAIKIQRQDGTTAPWTPSVEELTEALNANDWYIL
jgi:hypothetical protein